MSPRISTAVRITIDVALAIAVAQGWWHVALVVGIAGLVVCRNFIEIIAAGIAYDALFRPTFGLTISSHLAGLVATCAFALTVLVHSSIRRRI